MFIYPVHSAYPQSCLVSIINWHHPITITKSQVIVLVPESSITVSTSLIINCNPMGTIISISYNSLQSAEYQYFCSTPHLRIIIDSFPLAFGKGISRNPSFKAFIFWWYILFLQTCEFNPRHIRFFWTSCMISTWGGAAGDPHAGLQSKNPSPSILIVIDMSP